MDAFVTQRDFFSRLQAPAIVEDEDPHYEPHLRPRVAHPGIPRKKLDDAWRRFWKANESSDTIATEMMLPRSAVVAAWRQALEVDIQTRMEVSITASRAAGPIDRPTQHDRERMSSIDPEKVYKVWLQLSAGGEDGVLDALSERYGVQPRTISALLAKAGRAKAARPGNQNRRSAS